MKENEKTSYIHQRNLIGAGFLLVLLVAGTIIGFPFIVDYGIRKQALNITKRFRSDMLNDGRIHVIIVGTGAPAPDPDHVQSCVAIIADGSFIMLDAGGASAYRADLLGLPLYSLEAIFLSHLHSDHIADVPLLANNSWRYGRTSRLSVYGPVGTRQLVEGFNLAHEVDLRVRFENMKKFYAPPDIAKPHGDDISTPGPSERKLVYQAKNGLKVYAFRVSHEPVKPAVGNRVEYQGKVVVYSGDTKRDENIARHSKNADVLIHEAYNKELVNRMLELTEGDPIDDPGTKMTIEQGKQVHHYHTSPVDAASLAERATVKTLVFTHIIPPLGPTPIRKLITEPMFLKGVDDIFKGEVIIANDGLEIVL